MVKRIVFLIPRRLKVTEMKFGMHIQRFDFYFQKKLKLQRRFRREVIDKMLR